jgi:hypothetical protein
VSQNIQYNKVAVDGHFAAGEQPSRFQKRSSRRIQIAPHIVDSSSVSFSSRPYTACRV